MTEVDSPHIALVLAAVHAWERRDKHALLECFSPDFEFILSGQILDQPLEIHGHEEYARFFDTWLESWETFTFKADRIADLDGDRVLVKTMQHGVSRDEGIGVDRVVWFLADIEDAKIVRYRAFVDEARAFDAAEIQAWPPGTEQCATTPASANQASGAPAQALSD